MYTPANKNPMKITFTSKETYLAWRAEWRAKYAELSKTIRQCRIDHDRSGREFYRTRAREMMEVRKESKVEAQRQYLAAKAARELAESAHSQPEPQAVA
jgi:hypothetical protein